MIADIMTKALGPISFKKHRNRICHEKKAVREEVLIIDERAQAKRFGSTNTVLNYLLTTST